MHKEVREIAKKLKAQGWRIDESGPHPKAIPPDSTKPIVVLPSTPGRGRWKQNLISQLRKSGANL